MKKPKKYDARDIIIGATALGLVSTIFDFITFAVFRPLGERPLQTLWFIQSILTELVLIFSLRTRGFFLKGRRPPALIAGLAAAAAFFTVAIPLTAAGRRLFRFAQPEMWQLLLIAGIVAAYFAATETVKLWFAKRNNRSA